MGGLPLYDGSSVLTDNSIDRLQRALNRVQSTGQALSNNSQRRGIGNKTDFKINWGDGNDQVLGAESSVPPTPSGVAIPTAPSVAPPAAPPSKKGAAGAIDWGNGNDLVLGSSPASTPAKTEEMSFSDKLWSAGATGLKGAKLTLDWAANALASKFGYDDAIDPLTGKSTKQILAEGLKTYETAWRDPVMKGIMQKVDDAPDFTSGAHELLKGMVENPSTLPVFLAEQLPAAAIGGVVGKVVGTAALTAAKGAGTKLAQKEAVELTKEEARKAAKKEAIVQTATSGASIASGAVVTQSLGANYAEGMQKFNGDHALASDYAATKTLSELPANAVAGALIAWTPLKGTRFRDKAANVLIQANIQGAGGSSGAYMAAKSVGEDASRSELLLEYVGESFTAPLDIALAKYDASKKPAAAATATSPSTTPPAPATAAPSPSEMASSTPAGQDVAVPISGTTDISQRFAPMAVNVEASLATQDGINMVAALYRNAAEIQPGDQNNPDADRTRIHIQRAVERAGVLNEFEAALASDAAIESGRERISSDPQFAMMLRDSMARYAENQPMHRYPPKRDTRNDVVPEADSQAFVEPTAEATAQNIATANTESAAAEQRMNTALGQAAPFNPNAPAGILGWSLPLELRRVHRQIDAVPLGIEPETPAAGPTPRGVVGFTTSQGSTYSVDQQGNTSRTKRSMGQGQGKTYLPHSVMYVSEEDSQNIMADMSGSGVGMDLSYEIGYVTENNAFRRAIDRSTIPAGAQTVVAVIDHGKKTAVGVYKAYLEPAVGLAPVEKRTDGTTDWSHVGHAITEISYAQEAGFTVGETAPKATSLRHFTLPERAANLRRERRFTFTNKPVFGTGSLDNSEKVGRFAGERVYLSLDDAVWSRSRTFTPSGSAREATSADGKSGEGDVFFDYDNQKWMFQPGKWRDQPLEGVDVDVSPAARTLVLDSPEALRRASQKYGPPLDNEAFWKKLSADYDTVEIRNVKQHRDASKFFRYAKGDQVIVLNPDVVKVAETAAPTVKPASPYIPDLFSIESREPNLYSALSRGISTAPDKIFSASGKQVSLWMKANFHKLGAKKEELHLSGVLDWLDTKTKVSKQEVMDFLEHGGVKIKEMELSGPDTVYERIKPPGGENYREVLLTLSSGPQKNKAKEALQNFKIAMEEKYGINWKYLMTDAEVENKDLLTQKLIGMDYLHQSTHWDPSNVIAHMRVDDVIGADGKRYLRVLEIQSDWAKAVGRMTKEWKRLEAYEQSLRDELKAYEQSLRDEYIDQLAKETSSAREAGFTVGEQDIVELVSEMDIRKVALMLDKSAEHYDRVESYEEDLEHKRHDAGYRYFTALKHSGLPESFTAKDYDIPFVTDTGSWTRLVIKQAIAMTMRGGHDGIVFSTGQQQVPLYGSEEIAWVREGDEWRVAGIQQSSGNDTDIEGEARAREVLDHWKGWVPSMIHTIRTKADLLEIVRSILADNNRSEKVTDRVWERMQTEDAGTSLPRKEGMESFYDEIVPQEAGKVLNQLGASDVKVSSISIKTGDTITEQKGFVIPTHLRVSVVGGIPLFSPKSANQEKAQTTGVDAETDGFSATNIPKAIGNLIDAGASSEDILTFLSRAVNADEFTRTVARMLLPYVGEVSPKIVFGTPYMDNGKLPAGMYDPVKNVIVMVRNNFSSKTFLHEYVHALTVGSVSLKVKTGKEVNGIYERYKKAVGDTDVYGFTNALEFIAEAVSNKEFQDLLRSTKVDGIVGRLWKRIVDLFSRIFNIKQKDVIERLLDAVDSMASTANKMREKAVSKGRIGTSTMYDEGDKAPAANKSSGRVVAIIGTAGRDKTKPMTKDLWDRMLSDARSKVRPDDILTSGGAAWSDHVAVAMFLEGRVAGLRLRLPAPMLSHGFAGGRGSSGGTANYYHSLFSKTIGRDSLAEIRKAIANGAEVTQEPEAIGYKAMFARNKKIANESTAMIAYTFGDGNVPTSGGTLDTWNASKATDKQHVSLGSIPAAIEPTTKQTEDIGKTAPSKEGQSQSSFEIVKLPFNQSQQGIISGHRAKGADVRNAKPGTPGALGNPFVAEDVKGGKYTREEAVALFKEAFLKRVNEDPEYKNWILSLRGKKVGYYKPDEKHIHLHVVQKWLEQQTQNAKHIGKTQPGENIASRSRDGSPLGQALTNVTFDKWQINRHDLVSELKAAGLIEPTDGKSAEHWYKANKASHTIDNQDAVDMATMKLIIEAKLKQYPNLVEAIDRRGGSKWLMASTHQVFSSPRYRPSGFTWEGTGQESGFLRVLDAAYRSVKVEATKESKPDEGWEHDPTADSEIDQGKAGYKQYRIRVGKKAYALVYGKPLALKIGDETFDAFIHRDAQGNVFISDVRSGLRYGDTRGYKTIEGAIKKVTSYQFSAPDKAAEAVHRALANTPDIYAAIETPVTTQSSEDLQLKISEANSKQAKRIKEATTKTLADAKRTRVNLRRRFIRDVNRGNFAEALASWEEYFKKPESRASDFGEELYIDGKQVSVSKVAKIRFDALVSALGYLAKRSKKSESIHRMIAAIRTSIQRDLSARKTLIFKMTEVKPLANIMHLAMQDIHEGKARRNASVENLLSTPRVAKYLAGTLDGYDWMRDRNGNIRPPTDRQVDYIRKLIPQFTKSEIRAFYEATAPSPKLANLQFEDQTADAINAYQKSIGEILNQMYRMSSGQTAEALQRGIQSLTDRIDELIYVNKHNRDLSAKHREANRQDIESLSSERESLMRAAEMNIDVSAQLNRLRTAQIALYAAASEISTGKVNEETGYLAAMMLNENEDITINRVASSEHAIDDGALSVRQAYDPLNLDYDVLISAAKGFGEAIRKIQANITATGSERFQLMGSMIAMELNAARNAAYAQGLPSAIVNDLFTDAMKTLEVGMGVRLKGKTAEYLFRGDRPYDIKAAEDKAGDADSQEALFTASDYEAGDYRSAISNLINAVRAGDVTTSNAVENVTTEIRNGNLSIQDVFDAFRTRGISVPHQTINLMTRLPSTTPLRKYMADNHQNRLYFEEWMWELDRLIKDGAANLKSGTVMSKADIDASPVLRQLEKSEIAMYKQWKETREKIESRVQNAKKESTGAGFWDFSGLLFSNYSLADMRRISSIPVSQLTREEFVIHSIHADLELAWHEDIEHAKRINADTFKTFLSGELSSGIISDADMAEHGVWLDRIGRNHERDIRMAEDAKQVNELMDIVAGLRGIREDMLEDRIEERIVYHISRPIPVDGYRAGLLDPYNPSSLNFDFEVSPDTEGAVPHKVAYTIPGLRTTLFRTAKNEREAVLKNFLLANNIKLDSETDTNDFMEMVANEDQIKAKTPEEIITEMVETSYEQMSSTRSEFVDQDIADESRDDAMDDEMFVDDQYDEDLGTSPMDSDRLRQGAYSGVVSATQINLWLKKLVSTWKTAPNVVVLQNHLQLPEPLRGRVTAKLAKGHGAKGLYDGSSGTTYLFSDYLTSDTDAEFTLYHELYGHHGLRALLGSDFDAFLDRVYRTNASVRKMADSKIAEGLPKLEAVEEILSDVAAADEAPSAVTEFIGKIIAGLRKIGMHRVADWFSYLTTAELQVTLRAARNAARTGVMNDGAPTEIRLAENVRNPYEIFSSKGGKTTAYARYNPVIDQWYVFTADPNSDLRGGNYTTTSVIDYTEVLKMMQAHGKVEYRMRSSYYIDDTIPADFVRLPKIADLGKWQHRLHRMRTMFQNEHAAVFDMIDYMLKYKDPKTGQAVKRMSRKFDIKTGITLSERKTAYDVEQFNHHFVTPIMDIMRKLRGVDLGIPPYKINGVDVTNKDHIVDLFLLAQHAKERNRQTNKVNPGLMGGSGLQSSEADNLLKWFEKQSYYADLKAIGDKLDEMSTWKVGLEVSTGMISKQEGAKRMGAYQHYRNLSGIRGSTDEDVLADSSLSLGRKWNVRGKDKRATGRTDVAPDILARTLVAGEAAIIRGHKNKIAQTVLMFLETNYDPEFVVINEISKSKFVNRETGLVDFKEQSGDVYLQREDVMIAKVNGTPIAMRFKETGGQTFAEAMLGERKEMHPVMDALAKYQRFFGQMLTTYNPAWIPVNFVRDVQTMYSNAAADGRIKPGMAKQMMKALPSAIKASFHIAFNEFTPKTELGKKAKARLQKIFNLTGKAMDATYITKFLEYTAKKAGLTRVDDADYRAAKKAGGITLFIDRFGLEDQMIAVDHAINGATGVDAAMTRITGFLHFMELLSLPMEMAPRIAAYKVMRENGFSEDQAAVFSGEVTVNFNMRGTSKNTRALFLFFNPAVQGTAKIAKVWRSNPKKANKILLTWIGIGAMFNLLGRAISGDDDDDINKLEKISASKRSTHAIWNTDQLGGSIPIAYGYNAFFSVGQFMMDSIVGDVSASTSLKRIAGSAFGAFSPIGQSGFESESLAVNVGKTIAPTGLIPVVSWIANENRFGAPIRLTSSQFGSEWRPDTYMNFDSANPVSVATTRALHNLTGGNRFSKEGVDINPALVDFIFESYAPGVINESYKTIGAAVRWQRGETLSQSQAAIPILDRFKASVPEQWDAGAFRKVENRLASPIHEFEHVSVSNARKEELLKEYPNLDKVSYVISSTKNAIRMYDKGHSIVIDSDEYPEAQRVEADNRLKSIKKELYDMAAKQLIELGYKHYMVGD